MKFLKGLLFILLALVVLLALGGLLLPASAHVERTQTIHAPVDRVFPMINDLHAFNEWSPWANIDPETRYEFSDPASGAGARMSWHSEHPQVGKGSMEIIRSEAPRRIEVALDFGEQGTAVSFYDLVPGDGSTQVTWGFDTEFGYDLIGRYMGLLFDKWIGADYEQGLRNLKAKAEAAP